MPPAVWFLHGGRPVGDLVSAGERKGDILVFSLARMRTEK